MIVNRYSSELSKKPQPGTLARLGQSSECSRFAVFFRDIETSLREFLHCCVVQSTRFNGSAARPCSCCFLSARRNERIDLGCSRSPKPTDLRCIQSHVTAAVVDPAFQRASTHCAAMPRGQVLTCFVEVDWCFTCHGGTRLHILR